MAYFDPKGRMTIGQWNTASQGTDYRIGPRETKIETYTWTLPQTLPEGAAAHRGQAELPPAGQERRRIS